MPTIYYAQRHWSPYFTYTDLQRTKNTGSGVGRYSKPLRNIPEWRDSVIPQ